MGVLRLAANNIEGISQFAYWGCHIGLDHFFFNAVH